MGAGGSAPLNSVLIDRKRARKASQSARPIDYMPPDSPSGLLDINEII